MDDQAACSITDCSGPLLARGWCIKHYRRWQRHDNPLHEQSSEVERFSEKVERGSADACLLWIGALSSLGYGVFRVGGKTVYAHRWAYEHEVGPIPEGLTLDHLCRVRRCVEVKHLEAVTLKTNILRGDSPAARNARKTHCLRGHGFTPENTHIAPSGGRLCRECRQRRAPESMGVS